MIATLPGRKPETCDGLHSSCFSISVTMVTCSAHVTRKQKKRNLSNQLPSLTSMTGSRHEHYWMIDQGRFNIFHICKNYRSWKRWHQWSRGSMVQLEMCQGVELIFNLISNENDETLDTIMYYVRLKQSLCVSGQFIWKYLLKLINVI